MGEVGRRVEHFFRGRRGGRFGIGNGRDRRLRFQPPGHPRLCSPGQWPSVRRPRSVAVSAGPCDRRRAVVALAATRAASFSFRRARRSASPSLFPRDRVQSRLAPSCAANGRKPIIIGNCQRHTTHVERVASQGPRNRRRQRVFGFCLGARTHTSTWWHRHHRRVPTSPPPLTGGMPSVRISCGRKRPELVILRL